MVRDARFVHHFLTKIQNNRSLAVTTKSINMCIKFKLFAVATFGFSCIPFIDGNAITPSPIPLWSDVVCGWAVSQCQQGRITGRYGKEVCNSFNKRNQPYLCAGADNETGYTDCLTAYDKHLKNRSIDMCAAGYKVCLSNAFKSSHQ